MASWPLFRRIAVAFATACLASVAAGQDRVVIGSKAFPESHLLGEIMTLLLRKHTGLEVEHRSELGGTLICHEALLQRQIDLYPEYTGTVWSLVLGEEEQVTDSLRVFLHVEAQYRRLYDLEWLQPFGFDNTYVLALAETRAAELDIETLSDLAAHPGLRAGFSFEFLNRADGYPGLVEHYGIELDARGVEHGLAYEALVTGEIDLFDAYSTDGKLRRFPVRLLVDDRGFFPPYQAAPVVHGALLREHPIVGDVLSRLAFVIDDRAMSELNHRVDVGGERFGDVARDFLEQRGLLEETSAPHTRAEQGFVAFLAERRGETARLLWEHVVLTLLSVALATLLAVPLGIWITRNELAARISLGAASVLQTIPSLALLAVLIAVPGLGLSTRSAVFALFLYALLPILRNTHTGVRDIDPELIDAARAIGLTERETLLRVRLPIASRTIMAGIRTATVISVGVATLAAFIGAGGLGEPIITGLYLTDKRLILSGAVPAALLAIVADIGLGRLERVLTPRGLRT